MINKTIDIRQMFAGIRADNTVRNYEIGWRRYMEFIKAERNAVNSLRAQSLSVRPEVFSAWKLHMIDNTELAPSTINANIKSVKAVFSELERLGLIKQDQLRELRRVKMVSNSALQHRVPEPRRTWLTPEQMRQICDTPKPNLHEPLVARDRAYLLTMASSGMRISESILVKVEDIAEMNGFYVIKNVWGKHQNKSRIVPLSKEAYHAIQDWLFLRPVKSPYVFSLTVIDPNNPEILLYNEKNMGVGQASYIIRRATEANNIKARPHDFRRFVGSQLARRNIYMAQSALGHSDIKTTLAYYTEKPVPVGVTEDLF